MSTESPVSDGQVTEKTQSSEPEYYRKPTLIRKILSWTDEKTGWYPPEMSLEERDLIRKIDFFVLGYCCLAFFTKYLDVSALNNAYVSGMKEDLDLGGNQLNYITAVYQVGYCTFQIPSNILITKLPSQYYLPSAEIVWGLFTLGTAFVKSYNQLLALRFFVGFGATACYVGCLHIVNCWYKKVELGRRNAIYYSAMPLGTMVASYLQAALLEHLDGANGLQGWQWLFIICAIITIPIAAFGFFFFPDVPEKTTSRWFSERERKLAFDRLQNDGFEASKGLSWNLVRRVFGTWQFWTFIFMGNLFWLAPYAASNNPFILWLEALTDENGNRTYSDVLVNNLSSVTSAVSIVSALLTAVYSDWRRNRWEMMLLAGILMLVGNILLLVWDLPRGALWAGFMLLGLSNGPGNLVIVWAAETFAHDVEARAITLASINATNCMLYLVIPLGAWQVKDSPRFYAGYVTSVCMSAVQVFLIPVAVFFQRRDAKRLAQQFVACEAIAMDNQDLEYVIGEKTDAVVTTGVEINSKDGEFVEPVNVHDSEIKQADETKKW
ncbi:major facilitator superfamily domain-containing protein [Lipomyces oligophaga]|uniref:major facilitator superfamily domain-containing protein n=1 Tax=Lipomyces oligophaga TaxID=45792 RepID=UPI0034CFBA0E